jgi:hypothetical protein
MNGGHDKLQVSVDEVAGMYHYGVQIKEGWLEGTHMEESVASGVQNFLLVTCALKMLQYKTLLYNKHWILIHLLDQIW